MAVVLDLFLFDLVFGLLFEFELSCLGGLYSEKYSLGVEGNSLE